VSIPAELMRLIITRSGRVTLVIGAGSSVDPPTNLPLADQLAREAYSDLLADGILTATDCQGDTDDLSAVADCVFAKTGSQGPLVKRFRVERFENASANEGHLLAAALLLEDAIGAIVTLNFDMAIWHALADLGAGGDASIVDGPEDAGRLGVRNVVFLHRSARADPERWVLRTASIDREWRDGWEAIAASRVMAVGAVLLVGLGTPATVLVETALLIKDRAADIQLFLAGRRTRDRSAYAGKLGIDDDHYIKASWVDLMRLLSNRIAADHGAELATVCDSLVASNNWTNLNHRSVSAMIVQLGLLGVGRLRAAWLLRDRPYWPVRDATPTAMFGDLILALAAIKRDTSSTLRLLEFGLVELERADGARATVLIASGMGTARWSSMADVLESRRRGVGFGSFVPRLAVVSGTTGTMEGSILPLDVISITEDLIDPGPITRVVHADELHNDPTLAATFWN
jgi:hypothetical protein